MKSNLFPPRELQIPNAAQYHTPQLMEAYTKFINIQQLHAINYKKVWGEFQQMQFKKGELVEDKIINENNSQNNEYMSDTIQAEVVSNESSEFDNEVRLSSSDQVSDDLDDE